MRVVHYLKEYWRFIVASVAGGLGVGLFAVWGITFQLQKGSSSLFQDNWFLSFSLFFIFCLLCVGWRPAVNFWRRYRSTRKLLRPPVLYIELLSVGIACAVGTVAFFREGFLFRFLSFKSCCPVKMEELILFFRLLIVRLSDSSRLSGCLNTM